MAAVATTSLTLVACQTGSVPDENPDMGRAVADPSPESVDPAGVLVGLPEGFSEVSDMEVAGDILGLRAGDALAIGTLEEFEAGDSAVLEIPETCGDLNASTDTFVVACDEQVLLIDAAAPTDTVTRDVSDNAPAASAALTNSGALLVGNGESNTVSVHREGEDTELITVAGPTSQLLAVPVDGEEDIAVRTNTVNTTIQDVHWEDGEQGGTLRVGLGVGQISGGEDGLIIASDNIGDQLAIYTATEVIRLHQTAPVDPSPWAVAWDSERDLAWIASTANNSLVGYDISTGVPVEQMRLSTLADAHNAIVLPDGTLVLASATGDGLQVIADPESFSTAEPAAQ
ncbi:hypothetical protein C5L39_01890 [Corynebacterium alimapuense]|uniref:Prolipoprotein LppL n=2 Tax=Corynebacterium alimapuense TaxID=1576874 RepID=A0A3M8K7N0_9CORY|nr:hypothetical protein C5L39_01890 [Corynebacterium alimapuense]